MKLNKLTIQNLRNHESTVMELDKFNLIGGQNAAGKSTVKSSLMFALTGESEWGGSSKDLIRYGQEKAVSAVEIEGFGTVQRTAKAEGGTEVRLERRVLPDKEVEGEFLDTFGVGYNVLTCVLDSSDFFKMSPGDQKDFLFNLTRAVLNPQKVLEYMEKPSVAAKDIVLAQLSDRVTMEGLDAAYKVFFADRRAAKKTLDELKVQMRKAAKPAAQAPFDLKAITEKQEKLKASREKAVKSQAVIQEGKKQVIRFEESMKRIDDEIAKQRKALGQFSPDELEEEIFGCVTEINAAKKDYESNNVIFNVLTAQIEPLKGIVAKLNTPICPLSEKLVCKTDKTVLTGELSAQIENGNKEIAAAKAAMEKAEKLVEKWTKQKEQYEKELEAHRALDAVLKQKALLEQQKPSLPQGDDIALQKEIDGYDTQIREFAEQQKAVETWEREVKEAKQLEDSLRKATEKVDLYEYLVKEFSPKGIKVRILKKVVGPIEDHINQVLDKLTNGVYRVMFDFTNDFNIYVKHALGQIPASHLSPSEHLRISMVFQDAVNALSNIRVLVVDNIEILDKENEVLLFETLEELAPRYETIILIGTLPVAKIKKLAPSAKCFWVENGSVSVQ
jgi:DNA repair exonuclease SbcCD ATPase subunit